MFAIFADGKSVGAYFTMNFSLDGLKINLSFEYFCLRFSVFQFGSFIN